MGLQLIGAGFGRTGTLSLKAALEQLSLGPCYHMAELLKDPTRTLLWTRAARGETVAWDDVFQGYKAAVDWPACAFWPELTSTYPNAKVLLTVRDPEEWYESFTDTVLTWLCQSKTANLESRQARQMRDMIEHVIVSRSLGGKVHSKVQLLDTYNRHNAAVRAIIPPGRLLEYRIADGWKPLCDSAFPCPSTRSRD